MLGMSLVYYVLVPCVSRLLYVKMRFIHFCKSDEIRTDLENWLNIVLIDILSKMFFNYLIIFILHATKQPNLLINCNILIIKLSKDLLL